MNCATEAQFKTQSCIILSSTWMHLTLLSNIQKYMSQEYKEALRLVKGRLNECEEKTAQLGYSISTL